MITASFQENSHHILYGCHITGHSDYDEKGRDIVCAAVSALSVNTANSIEALTDDNVQVTSQDGDLTIFVPELQEASCPDEASLLLSSLKLGLEDISHSYGQQFLTISTITKTGGQDT